jgi:hypothetical protein
LRTNGQRRCSISWLPVISLSIFPALTRNDILTVPGDAACRRIMPSFPAETQPLDACQYGDERTTIR